MIWLRIQKKICQNRRQFLHSSDFGRFMIDRRFPTALQIMQNLLLANRMGMARVSSAQFAEWLGANPTLVRKLLFDLAECGLIESQMGRYGGARLARPADEITLSEIYEAAVAEKKLWEARPDIPHNCIVSTNFERYFDTLVHDVDNSLRQFLSRQTLAASLDELLKIHNSRTKKARKKNSDSLSKVHV